MKTFLASAVFLAFLGVALADEPGTGAPAPAPATSASGGKARPEVPNLTDEQKQQIRQAVEAHRTEAEPIFQRMLAARRARLEAVLAVPSNESRIRELSAEYARCDTEMAVFISKLYGEILPVLTEEQRTWLNGHKDDLERYFESQIGRGLDRLRQKQQAGQPPQ